MGRTTIKGWGTEKYSWLEGSETCPLALQVEVNRQELKTHETSGSEKRKLVGGWVRVILF
jgi:hypothetical protein